MAHNTPIVLLGNPVEHSISPQMQNAAFKLLQLPFEYQAKQVDEEGFESALNQIRSGEWTGANVTIPHKSRAARLVDVLSPEAQSMGVVNTIERLGDGRLKGHNTDGRGFLESLSKAMPVIDGEVTFLGAGGAAKAVAHMVTGQPSVAGIEYRVRSPEKVHVPQNHDVHPFDAPWLNQPGLLIQSTPVGLNTIENTGEWDEALDCYRTWLPQTLEGTVAVDLIYRPEQTPFLAVAKERGAQCVSGLGMLIYQGALAFQIWTGRQAPVDHMWKAARKALAGPT